MPKRKAAETVAEIEPAAGPAKKARSRAKVLGAASSSADNSALATSSKPAKRSRKKKDPDVTEPEKRAAKFKSACPQNIQERVSRVMSQR